MTKMSKEHQKLVSKVKIGDRNKIVEIIANQNSFTIPDETPVQGEIATEVRKLWNGRSNGPTGLSVECIKNGIILSKTFRKQRKMRTIS